MSNSTENPSNKDNTKLTLILIYIFWPVGLFLHFQNKTKVGAFHLRQIIGLVIGVIVAQIIIGVLASIIGAIIGLLGLVVSIFCFVCWIIGLLGALKGEEKLMPVVGPLSQKFLGKAFE